jgi:hypothetical protein
MSNHNNIQIGYARDGTPLRHGAIDINTVEIVFKPGFQTS